MAQKVENIVKLEIVTPYKKFFQGDVTSVVITTIDGQMGFMAGHPPLIVALSPGMSHLVQNGETKYFTLSEGYCEVTGDGIKIICNAFLFANFWNRNFYFNYLRCVDSRITNSC